MRFSKVVRSALYILADAAVLAASLWLSAAIMYGTDIPEQIAEALSKAYPVTLLVVIALFSLVRIYQIMAKYVGIADVLKVAGVSFAVAVINYLFIGTVLEQKMPIGFGILLFFFFMSFRTAITISYRVYCGYVNKHQGGESVPAILVGAGEAGSMIINEIRTSERISYDIKCVIDDDVNKIGKYFRGIQIIGGREEIPAAIAKYAIKEVIIAIPSISGAELQKIVFNCAGCKVKILPGIYQLLKGDVRVSKLREVSIEDLLSRQAIEIDLDSVMGYVSGKTVLVTGGGGSIGSELCRQLAAHKPGRLIVLDIYENSAYDLQQEIKTKYPELLLDVVIASVRDKVRIDSVFAAYRPQIIYHAAAHKHVPLMEDSPNEAIKNNVFGTRNVAEAADKYQAEKMVLISTDKAVNPTNVMGATKRICEMIVQEFNRRSETEFVAVRFGNVLGSNGSVIPLFKKQIAQGGPVLVTHPEIIRFFMTIPEAVSLVIQAGAYAKGGEIFVLDMGAPVKILDLALNLIRLSGYEPYKDIDIKFTGLRPGEKLYEELLMKEEGMRETQNKLIHIGKPIDFDGDVFIQKLGELEEVCKTEPDNARMLIADIVPTYSGDVRLNNL